MSNLDLDELDREVTYHNGVSGDTLRLLLAEARRARTLDGSLEKAEAELEQTRVQLAGCTAAALGATADPAKPGDYGWSASYGDVLALRVRCEKAEAQRDELAARVKELEGVPVAVCPTTDRLKALAKLDRKDGA